MVIDDILEIQTSNYKKLLLLLLWYTEEDLLFEETRDI